MLLYGAPLNSSLCVIFNFIHCFTAWTLDFCIHLTCQHQGKVTVTAFYLFNCNHSLYINSFSNALGFLLPFFAFNRYAFFIF